MSLHNLFLAITIDDRIQALKGASTHQIAHALLLNAKTLYLIVDVKEQRIIAG